ncbi:MAG TPA: LuxR C-terminal-related transcriptional regulator [Candidatus Micrarchaeia archaeon]|nr:LuxR C-terminal-related transcriptional regulator [Candidatus Micrarchaeia archaeon]
MTVPRQPDAAPLLGLARAAAAGASAAGAAGAVTLQEREEALEVVGEACHRARTGGPAVVFVAATSGLGKTSVLRSAAAGAPALRIGTATGVVAESGLPNAFLASALSGLGAAHLFEEPAPMPDSRGARFYAVLRWLRGVSEPSLLVLDDLQWADADSLALLGFVCRRLAGLPVAVVAATRPWPPAALEMAEELAHAAEARLVRLEPLSQAAAGRLLQEATGRAAPAELVRRVQALCGGNPLLLRELALAMRDGATVPRIGARGTGAHVLLARFAGVPPPALRYAQVASVFGARFRPGLVPQVTGVTAAEGADALGALLRAGVVEPEVHGFVSFVHPLFRETLYDDLPAPLRSHLHAAALRVLVAAGTEPEEAAEHAVAGDLRGDPEAIFVLEAAGRAALLTGGAVTAVTHLSHAVELSGTAVTARRLLLLSEALVAAGDPVRAITIAERALTLPPAAADATVAALRQLGRAAFVAGRLDEASMRFERAAAAAGGLDPVHRLDTLLDSALTLLTTDPMPVLLRRGEEARGLASSGTAAQRALADIAWGTVAAISGDPRGVACVRAAAAEAADRPAADRDLGWWWRVDLARASVARQVEDFGEAVAIYEAAALPLERLGAPMPIVGLAIGHCDTLKRLGRLDDAEALLDRTAALIELTPTAAPWLELARLDMAQERGQPVAERGRALARSLGGDDRHRPLLWLWLWSVQGEDLVRRGAAAAALPFFRRCLDLARRQGIVDPCTVPWTRSAVEAAVAAGRLDEAETTLAWLEVHLQPWPCHGPRAVAAYGRGLVASRRGDEDAQGWFEAALSQLTHTTLPLVHARVLLALGRHLRHHRRAVAARPVLTESGRMAELHGAEWLAAAAHHELRAAGGRRRARSGPPDALTSQERRIAALAAEGRSNGEIGAVLFLSARTVEAHLGRIYAKLGISSRRELADRVPAIGA